MIIKRPTFTVERLRSLLDYDPVTGVFTRRQARGGMPAGSRAGTVNGRYRSISIDGELVLEHRLAIFYATGTWPEGEVDHRNLDKMDNRLDNLREASRSQNRANCPAFRNNRLGVKGVFPSGRRFGARIQIAGKVRHLGTFDTVEQAGAAYSAAAAKVFGDFARAA